MKPFYRIIILFSTAWVAAYTFAAEGVPSAQAILIEGTALSFGVPGFGANRIPALAARYRIEGGVARVDGVSLERTFRAWAVSEPLAFREGRWFEARIRGARVLESVAGTNVALVAVLATVVPREGSSVPARWYVVTEFDLSLSRDERIIAARTLASHAAASFSAARRVEDLSFPATVALFTDGKKM
jgi:hypothetical protein